MAKTAVSKVDQMRALREAEARAAERRAKEKRAAPLSRAEQMKLVDCEQNIAKGIETFVLVGASLATIREQRLYRDDYPTFEAYVSGRWGFTASRARQLIGAAEVVEQIQSVTRVTPPTNEAQARELVTVPEEQRVEVWEHAVETAAKPEKPTRKEVARAAAPHKPKRKPKPPEPEGGEDHEPRSSTPEEERAVVDEGEPEGEREAMSTEAAEAAADDAPPGSPSDSEAEPAEPPPVEEGREDRETTEAAQDTATPPDPSAGEPAAESPESHPEGGDPGARRLAYLLNAESALASAASFRLHGQPVIQLAHDKVREIIRMLRGEGS